MDIRVLSLKKQLLYQWFDCIILKTFQSFLLEFIELVTNGFQRFKYIIIQLTSSMYTVSSQIKYSVVSLKTMVC